MLEVQTTADTRLVQAELIAMNIAAQETVWLRNLMCEINAALTGLETRLQQAD